MLEWLDDEGFIKLNVFTFVLKLGQLPHYLSELDIKKIFSIIFKANNNLITPTKKIFNIKTFRQKVCIASFC